MRAILLLEDGSEFVGESFGATGKAFGEVVFNTSMTGYQEILTDPSYRGQIVTMTSTQIGNYGVNEEDFESKSIYLSGFVVREFSKQYSNWRGTSNLDTLLKQNNVVAISEIDTRALTRLIRNKGSMRALITTEDAKKTNLLEQLRGFRKMEGSDYVSDLQLEECWRWNPDESPTVENDNRGLDILALDSGIKHTILRSLHARGATLRIASSKVFRAEIERKKPDGLLLSNGPGDPAAISGITELVRDISSEIPILGICLGHQILGLSFGAKTYKMKFGHHGGNHPVKNLLNNKVEITAQNHSFAIAADSMPNDLELTHMSLFDSTVEGFRHTRLPVVSVQYHPESAPGPHDSGYLFDQFLSMVRDNKKTRR